MKRLLVAAAVMVVAVAGLALTNPRPTSMASAALVRPAAAPVVHGVQPAAQAALPACDGVRLWCPGMPVRVIFGAQGVPPIYIPPRTMPPGINSGQHDTPCPNDEPCGP